MNTEIINTFKEDFGIDMSITFTKIEHNGEVAISYDIRHGKELIKSGQFWASNDSEEKGSIYDRIRNTDKFKELIS